MLISTRTVVCFLFCFFTPHTFSGDFSISEGSSFYSARKEIMSSGWRPLKTHLKFEDGTYQSDFGEAAFYKEADIIEIEYCAGTGNGYCFFNYKKNSSCLRVTTEGMYDPKTQSPVILKWEKVDCKGLLTQ